ncbi:MAG TPA: hypothetical protein VG826_34765 [Pirellulales bacterium]|nr:hypothetical protein [Pirellulales bacterium]
MKRFLLSAVAVVAVSSQALGIGPFSRQVNELRHSSTYAPDAYSRNVRALQNAGGYRYNYSPTAHLGNFGGAYGGYGYGSRAYINGGYFTPFGYQPYNMTITPTYGGAIYQGTSGLMMPGFYQPYSFGGFMPSYYPAYGFGVY